MRLNLVAVLFVGAIAWLLPAAPAFAACPSSGGDAVPRAASPSGDVIFRGHGWGHGLGMSQYGANGAAALGCTHEQILERYYSGAQLSTDGGGQEVFVGIVDPRHQTSKAVGVEVITTQKSSLGAREIRWRISGCSSAGNCSTQPPRLQKPGEVWQMIPTADGAFRIYEVVNGTRKSTPLWVGGDAGATLAVEHDRAVITARPLIGGQLVNGRTLRWGQLEMTTTGAAVDGTSTSYVVQRVTAGPDLSGAYVYRGIDRYLWGLGEVPSSFELEAQKAQAVAARTYALRKIRSGFDSRCKCHLVTTPADQNYTGWSKESEDIALGSRWRDQVKATENGVMTYNGTLISALYSSSHGGHSESPAYVWGSTNPGYLNPIDDSRWEMASSNPSDFRSWAVGYTWEELASKLGFTRITDISVKEPIGALTRSEGVRIVGVKAGAKTTEYWTGWDVRQALRLSSGRCQATDEPCSPNFVIEVVRDLWKSGTPIMGDWDGNGTDDPGWYHDGQVALKFPDGVVKRYRYGIAGDIPIVGDFDGDGDDTVSIIRDREWHINHGLDGDAEKTFIYGRITAGDRPLAGDWDGDGIDSVGIVRRGEWHLRNDVGGGPGEIVFVYGRVLAGDIPITGDWLGRGRDVVGIVRGTEWHLRYELAGGAADRVFKYGDAALGDYPATGDFDRNGSDTTAIVRDYTWHLRNDLKGGPAQWKVNFKG